MIDRAHTRVFVPEGVNVDAAIRANRLPPVAAAGVLLAEIVLGMVMASIVLL